MYYHNKGGFKTKLLDLQNGVLSSDYSVIIIVETWLNNDITDEELGCMGYDIFRCDRDFTNTIKEDGGGILIAVKKVLRAKLIKVPPNTCEQLYVSLTHNNQCIIFGGLYIPPKSKADQYLEHTRIVEYVMDNHVDYKLVLCGDYNIPGAIWYNDDLGLNVDCIENSPANIILNSFSYYNLFQINSIPNSRNAILDLIFSSFRDIKVFHPIDFIFPNSIYHSAVTFNLSPKATSHLNYEEYFYDFKGGNYIGMNDFLASIEWNLVINQSDVDLSMTQFYDIMYTAMNSFIPVKKFKTSTFPVWYNSKLKKIIYDKKIIHKRYKTKENAEDYECFSRLRTRCKELQDQCYQQYINKIENNISTDPRSFWKYVNDKKKSHSLPTNMHYNDILGDNDQSIVTLFATYFSTVYIVMRILSRFPHSIMKMIVSTLVIMLSILKRL